MTNYIRRRFM